MVESFRSGYVTMTVAIGCQKPISVPFLVTGENIGRLIVAYNVIAEISNGGDVLPSEVFPNLKKQQAMASSLPSSKKMESA